MSTGSTNGWSPNSKSIITAYATHYIVGFVCWTTVTFIYNAVPLWFGHPLIFHYTTELAPFPPSALPHGAKIPMMQITPLHCITRYADTILHSAPKISLSSQTKLILPLLMTIHLAAHSHNLQ